MIDHTGANSQFGGLNHGLASAAYQPPGWFAKPVAKPAPTTRMTKIASRKFRIGTPAYRSISGNVEESAADQTDNASPWLKGGIVRTAEQAALLHAGVALTTVRPGRLLQGVTASCRSKSHKMTCGPSRVENDRKEHFPTGKCSWKPEGRHEDAIYRTRWRGTSDRPGRHAVGRARGTGRRRRQCRRARADHRADAADAGGSHQGNRALPRHDRQAVWRQTDDPSRHQAAALCRVSPGHHRSRHQDRGDRRQQAA